MINVAMIGVGYWGPNLLRNLVNNKDCNVVLVVDIAQARRNYVRHTYPELKVTGDIEVFYRDSKIDAVVIATPVETHFELTMNSLNSGKHVLVEKPMSVKVSEVNQIEKLSKKKNLVAMTGHTFLYNSAVRYVKKIIDAGTIGKIRYIYSKRVNLGRIRSDVDALWNLAPHDISIIQYWLGDPNPISVQRHGMDYIQEGIEDVVFLNILYPENVIANIHVSWLDPHKIREMTIVGTDKMLVYNDISDDKITVYDKGIDRMAILGKNMDFDKPHSSDFSHRSGEILNPDIDWEEPLKVEIEHFLDCIITDRECMTGTEHAKNVVRILETSDKIR